MRPRTKEAIELARYLDTLPADARAYALDMVYRVIGERRPPPEPPEPKRRRSGNVIHLFPRGRP